MPRKTGSGLATVQADATAALFVAVACEDQDGIDAAIEQIDQECDRERAGLSGSTQADLFEELLSDWSEARQGFSGGSATETALSDLRLRSTAGRRVLVEVKAQTKKAKFSLITQADWVRDDTDLLRRFARDDPWFEAARAGGWGRGPIRPVLASLAAGASDDLGIGELWVSDVGLLTSASRRERAGAESAQGLRRFLDRKWLLHVCEEGARLVPLGRIPAVERALSGVHPTFEVLPNKVDYTDRYGAGKLRVKHGTRTLFTYHLYVTRSKGKLMGRHKVHAALLEDVPGTLTARMG